MHTMNDLELAWAAGFFDGEGTSCCIRQENGRKALILNIIQAGPDSLHHLTRFYSAVGGIGKVFLYAQRSQNRVAGHQWRAYRVGDPLRVMRMLWRFLGPTKKRQFITALRVRVQWERQSGRSFSSLLRR